MQERALKAIIIALTTLLAIVVAIGAFLVAGTQNGNTVPIIETVFHEPVGDIYSPITLSVNDKTE